MLYDRRPCQPLCRPPDKRDFMEYEPAKSANDLYKSYNPMVGIGTAAILLLFVALLTVKSLLRWAIKQWRVHKFVRLQRKEQNASKKLLVTIVAESTELASPRQMMPRNATRQQMQPNGKPV